MHRILRWLLETMGPQGRGGEALLGDLDELFQERLARSGRLRANLWYGMQVLTAITRARKVGGSPSMAAGTMRSWIMGDSIRGIRHAIRRAGRSPLHAATVMGTLGLGVAGVTLVFALVDAVLLEPFPYPDPDGVVAVYDDNPGIDMPAGYATIPNYRDWKRDAASFEALAIFRGRSVTVGTDRFPEYAYGATVSSEFFDVFGVPPILGRGFTPEETTTAGPALVVLGDGLWDRAFGRDPSALGRTIDIDGAAHTIVGIMPPGFEAHGDWVGRSVDLWRPFPVDLADNRENRSNHVAGRLAPGVTLAQAREEMTRLHEALATAFPDANAQWNVNLERWSDLIVGDFRPALAVLFGVMMLVLAIAATNVANLTVGRTLARRGELATQMALGAGRVRLATEAMLDAGVLAVGGGIAGLLLALGGLRVVKALEPGNLPRLTTAQIDPMSIAVATGAALVAAVLIGSVAAFMVVRTGSPGRLQGRGVTRGHRLRSAFAAVQLAMSLALLTGAGLLLKSLDGLLSTDLGFDGDEVTTMTVALSWDRVSDLEDRARLSDELLSALSAIPGVDQAAMINSLPLSGSNSYSLVHVENVTAEDAPEAVAVRGVSAGYFAVMDVAIEEGRSFESDQELGSVIVNRTLAERYYPGESALGRRIRLGGRDDFRVIVGVVGDVKHEGPSAAVRPELFVPYAIETLTSKSYLVRSNLPLADLATPMRAALQSVDPDQPVREIRPMAEWTRRATAEGRFQATMTAVAAALAVTLAAVGLFAVLGSLVAERSREIAVRIAVGAERREVLGLVLLRAGRLLAIGLAMGLVAALLGGATLQGLLFGVSAKDPAVLAGAAALLLFVGLGAAWGPARRAASLDPATVLRRD